MITTYQTGIVEGHCSLLPYTLDDSPDTLAAVAMNLAARVVFATLCKIPVLDAEILFMDIHGVFLPEVSIYVPEISPDATQEEKEIRRTSDCFTLAAGIGIEMASGRRRNFMDWERDIKRISLFTPDSELIVAMMVNLFKEYPNFYKVCATVAYRLHKTRNIKGDELLQTVAQGIKHDERMKILKQIYDHVVTQ